MGGRRAPLTPPQALITFCAPPCPHTPHLLGQPTRRFLSLLPHLSLSTLSTSPLTQYGHWPHDRHLSPLVGGASVTPHTGAWAAYLRPRAPGWNHLSRCPSSPRLATHGGRQATLGTHKTMIYTQTHTLLCTLTHASLTEACH